MVGKMNKKLIESFNWKQPFQRPVQRKDCQVAVFNYIIELLVPRKDTNALSADTIFKEREKSQLIQMLTYITTVPLL